MKYTLVIWLLILLVSCEKNDKADTNSPPVDTTGNTAYLSSIRIFSPKSQTIDSFHFDSTHRLAKFSQYIHDSTSNPVIHDSLIAVFSLKPGAIVPDSYSYTYSTFGGPLTETHLLSYDAQNRIIKDTSLSGSRFVTYYSYPDNTIASTLLFKGLPTETQLDTLLLTNSNVTTEKIYYIDGTTKELSGLLNIGYSSLPNPAYHSAVANSIGPLLHILAYDGFGGFSDYISKNLVSTYSGLGIPTVTFSWVKDSKGRVAKGTSTILNSTIEFYYY